MNKENTDEKKIVGLKPKLQTLKFRIMIFLLLFIFSISFILINSYIKDLNYNQKLQNYITHISDNKLYYVGKLSLIRDSYNAIEINKNLILVFGKGEGNISKKGEIFDLRKKKTYKIIYFKTDHFDDYVFKFDDSIFIIGQEIELLNAKTLKSQLIDLPDDNHKFNGGFATKISKNEILFICGNFSLPINFVDENIRIYTYNTQNRQIKKIENIHIPKGLFNGFIGIKKPLVTVSNKTYLFACDYNKLTSNNGKKIIHSIEPTNCGIYIFNKENSSFDLVSTLEENSFPFYVEQLNDEELLVLSQRYIFSFNTNTKLVNKFLNKIEYPHIFARFISKAPNSTIIGLGTIYQKSPFGKNSYLVDGQSKEIYDFKLVDFNKTTLFNSYGKGSTIYTTNNNLVFIGLFDKNYVYSSK